jgi:GTP-binding protein
VDTAGVRRRTKVIDSVERFSVNSAIKSSTKAEVTLLVFDVLESHTTQDKRLLALLDERKTPFMVLLNKMDMVPKGQADAALREVREALSFCKHVPLIRVSAHTGDGLRQILPMADLIRKECSSRIPTAQLNRAFTEVLDRNQPPIVRNARPKFFYLTQAESNPPTFVFFVSDAERIKPTYARYLEKSLRAMFNIKHAPVRVHFRSSHKK